MSNKNVIPFPVRPKKPTPASSQTETKTRYDLEQRKILVSASLFSIVLVVTLANRALLKETVNEGLVAGSSIVGTRTIASIDGTSPLEAVHRNTEWEKSVAQDLARIDGRKPASLGHTPSVADKLRFGVLEGKYMVSFQDGKIHEIEFKSGAHEDAPRYLNDPKAFLEGQRELLPVTFGQILLNNKKILPTKVVESYDLFNTEHVVATARFELDIYGRLLTFRIEKTAILPSANH